jgi:GntR family transcriptional repressor for pyruvate dehydrogenase complex
MEELLELVRTLHVGPNGRLPSERKLAELLSASRTMLREALISLEALGVLEMRGPEGLFLTSTSPEEIKNILGQNNVWPIETLSEIMQIRLLLEPGIMAFAAANRTDEDVQKLLHCLEELDRLENPRTSIQAAGWNTILHSTIVKVTRNNTLFSFYDYLIGKMQDACQSLRMEIMGSTPEFTRIILEQHHGIVEAIIAQDAEKARDIGREHITHTIRGLIHSSQISPLSGLMEKSLDNDILQKM